MISHKLKKIEFVSGTTQSGKTTYSVEKGRRWSGGVFFWNPQDSTAKGYTKACFTSSIEQIKNALKKGKKINYYPIVNKKKAQQELDYIVQELLKAHIEGELDDTLFIVDECQIYARSGNGYNPVEDIATRGLGKGLVGTFITQRPALVSNTLFTQAEIKTYLRLEQEEWGYFRRNGVEIEKIQKEIRDFGKYGYISKYNDEYTKVTKI